MLIHNGGHPIDYSIDTLGDALEANVADEQRLPSMTACE